MLSTLSAPQISDRLTVLMAYIAPSVRPLTMICVAVSIRSPAEVSCKDFLICGHFCRRALPDDLAVVQQIDPIRNLHCPAGIFLNQQDGNPAALKVGNKFINLVDEERSKAERWLVYKKHPAIG